MQRRSKRCKIFFLLMILLSTMAVTFLFNQSEAATEYKYLIKVNKQKNCITIYEKDENGKYSVPVKAMICSTGNATPLGTYNTKVKYRWKILLEDVWGQYSTRITGSILFHSVWYYKQDPSTLSATQYNKLGTTCSHGCIRLTVEDAKWIYENCPIGTTVTIYNDSNPGPLGRPTAKKLKAGIGWDPTDLDPRNPFLKDPNYGLLEESKKQQAKLTLNGLKSQTIEWGSTFNPMAGVTAKDGSKADLTKKIKVSGKVNTQKPGTYTLKYSVSNNAGEKVSKSIKIQVLDCPYNVTFSGVKDKVISELQVVDRAYCLKGVHAYLGPIEIDQKKIEVSIKESDEGYCVTYKASAENGDSSTAVSMMRIDSESPVIEAEHLLYPDLEDINRDFVLKHIKVTDNYTKMTSDQIEIEIEEVYRWGHLITITAKDKCGNTAMKKVQYTKECMVVIRGVKNRVVPCNTEINRDLVMQGVTGWSEDKDITDKVKTTIGKPVNDEYEVTYELTNEYGTYTKIIAYFTKN